MNRGRPVGTPARVGLGSHKLESDGEAAMTSPERVSPALLVALAEQARKADAEPIWPGRSWELLQQTGALRWCVPAAYEGEEVGYADLLHGYEALAGACLTTCFILSQRDAACRR